MYNDLCTLWQLTRSHGFPTITEEVLRVLRNLAHQPPCSFSKNPEPTRHCSAMAQSWLTGTSATQVQSNSPASASQAAGIPEAHYWAQLIFRQGFHHVGQAGLKLLTSGDLSTSVSRSTQTTGRQGLALSPRLLECCGVIMNHCILKLLGSSNQLTSASQAAGTTGAHHHSQHFFFLSLERSLAMLPRLSSNSWPQAILPHRSPKVLGLHSLLSSWDYKGESPHQASYFIILVLYTEVAIFTNDNPKKVLDKSMELVA
ncbi:Zinc finger protein, partial [Plecturocebus cupreus]